MPHWLIGHESKFEEPLCTHPMDVPIVMDALRPNGSVFYFLDPRICGFPFVFPLKPQQKVATARKTPPKRETPSMFTRIAPFAGRGRRFVPFWGTHGRVVFGFPSKPKKECPKKTHCGAEWKATHQVSKLREPSWRELLQFVSKGNQRESKGKSRESKGSPKGDERGKTMFKSAYFETNPRALKLPARKGPAHNPAYD